jgi:hypothetical protein
LPIELHVKCKQYRTTMGLPPNVVSDPNWNGKEEEEDLPRESEEWNSVGRWEGTTGEGTDLSEPDGVEY